jgi:hypothetical protein
MKECVIVVVYFIIYFSISQEKAARSHFGNYSWIGRLSVL